MCIGEGDKTTTATHISFASDESHHSTHFKVQREYEEKKVCVCVVCEALIGNRRPWRMTKLQHIAFVNVEHATEYATILR